MKATKKIIMITDGGEKAFKGSLGFVPTDLKDKNPYTLMVVVKNPSGSL